MNINQKINNKKEELEELRSALDALVKNKEEREDATFTEEERAEFDSKFSEMENLRADIEQLEKENVILNQKETPKKMEARKSEENKIQEAFSFGEAIRQAKSGRLEGLYAELNQEGQREALNSGISVSGGITLPEFSLRANTVTQGTQPAEGANLVPTESIGIVEALYSQTIMAEAGVSMLSGLSANVDMPSESTVLSANFTGETTDESAQTPTFGKYQLQPQRLAVVAQYSDQLLRQSSPSIDAVLRRQAERAIADKLNNAFINGANAGAVEGLETVSGATSFTGTSFDYALALEIEQLLAEANINLDSAVIITSPAAKAAWKNAFKDAGSGNPVYSDENMVAGMRAIATNFVPDNLGTGTNESGIYAGDMSDVYVGSWGGLNIVVDEYTQASSGQIRLVYNSFWDIINTRPSALVKGSVVA